MEDFPPEDAQIVLYRITQEAFTNIAKPPWRGESNGACNFRVIAPFCASWTTATMVSRKRGRSQVMQSATYFDWQRWPCSPQQQVLVVTGEIKRFVADFLHPLVLARCRPLPAPTVRPASGAGSTWLARSSRRPRRSTSGRCRTRAAARQHKAAGRAYRDDDRHRVVGQHSTKQAQEWLRPFSYWQEKSTQRFRYVLDFFADFGRRCFFGRR